MQRRDGFDVDDGIAEGGEERAVALPSAPDADPNNPTRVGRRGSRANDDDDEAPPPPPPGPDRELPRHRRRVLVVGCGPTGSLTAALLRRR